MRGRARVCSQARYRKKPHFRLKYVRTSLKNDAYKLPSLITCIRGMGVGISSTCSKAVTALHIFSISDPKECKDYNKCQVFVKSGAEEDFG